ncbi:alpha/beta fold hydrolase [soil metagenome]
MRTTRSRARSRLAATATLAAFACLTTLDLSAQDAAAAGNSGVIRIQKQGSFYYGGRQITAPGTFEPTQPFGDNSGETFDVDKGYAFFQIPPNARQYPLVMWHGGGQHGKTYEDFEDRENYQSIFLRRGWSVYIIDQPRTGKAGYPSFTGPFGTLEGEEIIPNNTLAYGIKVGFNNFRLGVWDDSGRRFFKGVLFPRTEYALDQLNAQTIPIIGTDVEVNVSAQAALFRKVGPAVLITHSASGGPGWRTAMRVPRKVVGIVSYEPVGFVFPEGELPEGETGAVPLSDFRKLTRIPIQIIWGDFIDSGPLNRTILERSRRFAEAINRHGGDAEVIHLPDIGIQGNTHFPFADLNNHEIADLLSRWLRQKGLDRRGGSAGAVAAEE